MELMQALMKDTMTEEFSIEYLRIDDYKNHPRYSCAYCDKTHAANKCVHLKKKSKVESKKVETKTYEDEHKYSWYG